MTIERFEFDSVRKLRDDLVRSLLSWKHNEKLYGSVPPGIGRDSEVQRTSYTNSGMVLQALVEAGLTVESQELAQEITSRLQTTFPQQRESQQHQPHIFANSWACFAVLDCLPSSAPKMLSIENWVLQHQRDDGGWGFEPGFSSQYPATTAYALMVLLQFHDYRSRASTRDPKKTQILLSAIERGVAFLLTARPSGLSRDLLLWQAVKDDSSQRLSLGTSAIAMHVLAKAGRLLGKPAWNAMVVRSFQKLTAKFPESPPEPWCVAGFELELWDQVFITEGERNLPWMFFAPMSAVTLVRLSSEGELRTSESYRFIFMLVEWIRNHTVAVTKGNAVWGTDIVREAQVWSTAQAVIVLSRVLKNQYNLEAWYSDLSTVHNSEAREITAGRLDAISRLAASAPPSQIVRWGVFGSVAIPTAGVTYWNWHSLPDLWQQAEPVTYILGVLVSLAVVLGLFSAHPSVLQYLRDTFAGPTTLRKIRALLEEDKSTAKSSGADSNIRQ